MLEHPTSAFITYYMLSPLLTTTLSLGFRILGGDHLEERMGWHDGMEKRCIQQNYVANNLDDKIFASGKRNSFSNRISEFFFGMMQYFLRQTQAMQPLEQVAVEINWRRHPMRPHRNVWERARKACYMTTRTFFFFFGGGRNAQPELPLFCCNLNKRACHSF